MSDDKKNTRLVKVYFEQEIFSKYKLTKTDLCKRINCARSTLNNVLIGRSKLTLSLAAKISALFPDNENLSVDNLMKLQMENAIGEVKGDSSNKTQDTSTSNEDSPSFIPNIFKFTSTNIERWIRDYPIDSRKQFAVLIRRLVHSTVNSEHIIECDFPGNDESQRNGPDGIVKCEKGNAFVPEGLSHWEFGIDEKFSRKIKDDFKEAPKKHPLENTKNITYVAVTPWKLSTGKIEELKDEFNKENIWKEVRIYDANSLEQWLEISFSAQVYFSDISGINKTDIEIKLLETYWNNFSDLVYQEKDDNNQTTYVTDFHITESFFEKSLNIYSNQINQFFSKDGNAFLFVTSESKEESLAFIYSLLKSRESSVPFFERDNSACVFSAEGLNQLTKVGLKQKLTIITEQENLYGVQDLNSLRNNFKVIVISSKNNTLKRDLGGNEIHIRLYPLSSDDFIRYLKAQNLSGDISRKLSSITGNSVNILSLMYSRNQPIKKLQLIDRLNRMSASRIRCLLALAAIQKINLKNTKELELIKQLSGENDCKNIIEYLADNEEFVWKENNTVSIISKFSFFILLKSHISDEFVENFFNVLESIFFEKENYSKYNKQFINIDEEYSRIDSVILENLIDSLSLMATYKNKLFQSYDERHVFYSKLITFINELLYLDYYSKNLSNSTEYIFSGNRSEQKARLIFLFPYLSLIAETTPQQYLQFLTQDIHSQDSVIREFMQKEYSNDFRYNLFGVREYRSSILYSLERLAWIPSYFMKIIEILTDLTSIEINDNLVCKPYESLHTILRLYYPQTYVGYRLQFRAIQYVFKHSCKGEQFVKALLNSLLMPAGIYINPQNPKWYPIELELTQSYRNQAPDSHISSILELLYQSVINSNFSDKSNVQRLVEMLPYLPIMNQKQTDNLMNTIRNVVQTTDDSNRKNIKETILRYMQFSKYDKVKKELKKFIKENAESFDLTDPLEKYCDLFNSKWISENDPSIDKSLFSDIKGKNFEEKKQNLRIKALSEIYRYHGQNAILALIRTSPQSFYIGLASQKKEASLKDISSELLKIIVRDIHDCDDKYKLYILTEYIRGLYWKRKTSSLLRYITSFCKREKVNIIRLLIKFPLSLKLYESVKEKNNAEDDTYFWKNLYELNVWGLNDEEQLYALKKLIENGRKELLYSENIYYLRELPISELPPMLDKIADIIFSIRDSKTISKIDFYAITSLIKKVSISPEIQFKTKVELEFKFLPITMNFKEELCIKDIELYFEQYPEYFADYFDNNIDTLNGLSEQQKTEFYDMYFFKENVLSCFTHIAGQEGTTDEIDTKKLTEWIKKVQEYSYINNKSTNKAIAAILIHGPREKGILFPSKEIIEVYENIGNEKIAYYLYIEIVNGAGSPIVYEWNGGDSQIKQEQAYQQLKLKYSQRDYPNTYQLIDEVCRSYKNRAMEDNEEANMEKLGIGRF